MRGIQGAPENDNQVRSEIHSEAMIERVWRCNWRSRSSDIRDALGSHDWPSLEIHLEAEVEWTQRYTLRPWSREFGNALVAGYDRAWLEEYLEMVNLRVVDLEVVDGRRALCWDSIHRLVNSTPWECDEMILPLKLLWRTGWWPSNCVGRHAGSWSCFHGSTRNRENEGTTDNLRGIMGLVYAALGVCCTRCMLQLGVNSWSWHGEIQRVDLTLCSAMMVELWMRKQVMWEEDENNMEDKSGYETSGVQLAWLSLDDLISVILCTGLGLVPGVSGNVNWLGHEILVSPSFSWWFPPSPLTFLFLVLNSTIT